MASKFSWLIELKTVDSLDKTIILIRHGQSEPNVSNTLTSRIGGYQLTSLGRLQAENAGELISPLRIDSLYHSPVLRAVQTADIIGAKIKMVPRPDYRLRERHLGIYEEMQRPSGMEWKFEPSSKLEPWEYVKARMSSFMEHVDGRIIAATSHADPISAACDSIDGKGMRFHASNIPGPGTLTIIDIGSQKVLGKGVLSLPGELSSV